MINDYNCRKDWKDEYMKRRDLEDLFEEANMAFIRKNTTLFETQVSERTDIVNIGLHFFLKDV